MYDGVIFDLDGTVYVGDELIDGAERLIKDLLNSGVQVGFATNNTTKTPGMYVTKLKRLGISVTEDRVTNPIKPLVEWLQSGAPEAGVFALCEQPMRDALIESGVRLVDAAKDVGVVVASFDRTLDYHKLRTAFQALWRNPDCRLVATNLDRYCPMPGGSGEPDAGAIVAALEASAEVKCEMVFGKPAEELFRSACSSLGVDPQRCLMVGDRLDTDIAMAAAIGADSTLVLTGDSTRKDAAKKIKDFTPTYILDSLADIPDAIGLSV